MRAPVGTGHHQRQFHHAAVQADRLVVIADVAKGLELFDDAVEVRWHQTGYRSSTGRCFDIGITVRPALARYLDTGNPMAGSLDPNSAGNGSLMRLAPVVIRYADHPDLALRYAAESSRTTHGAPAAVDACRYFAALFEGAELTALIRQLAP